MEGVCAHNTKSHSNRNWLYNSRIGGNECRKDGAVPMIHRLVRIPRSSRFWCSIGGAGAGPAAISYSAVEESAQHGAEEAVLAST
mmetsp:Transcript_10705/g.19393  ORF Transcript_10705/g.19393 Transcript_10705/m.19393 type:complete len:85 (-) Transcript_10705:166-420(-)